MSKWKKFTSACLVAALSTALLAGCGGEKKDSAAANADKYVIGASFELTGNVANYGKSTLSGLKLAVDQVNKAGGVNGKQLVVVESDNKSEPAESGNSVTKLITQDKVVAVVGPATSGCVFAATPVVTSNKVPLIAPCATAPAITVDNGQVKEFIFRACFIDPFQGSVAAAYCDQQGYKTACIMFNNADAYAVGLKDAFVENFKGEVLAIEEYSGSDVKDYNVQLTKLAAQNPDVLLLPNLNVELGLQIQQARTAGLNCPIICGDSADTPDVANVAGPAIEGVAYVSAFSAESTDEAAKNFVDAYVKLYPDELPNSNAELTYETAKMVVWAIQNAKTLDRDGVRDALDTIDGLELPSGKMTMDPTTRNPIKGGVIMQYDAEGVTHYVSSVNP